MPKTVFKTKWFSVQEENSKFSNSNLPFYKIHIPDSVVIFPITQGGKVILIRQFRQALNKDTIEFPAGGLDKNENPKKTAVRELYEETGYRAKKIILLKKGLNILSNRSNAIANFYLATDCIKDVNFIPKEDIEILELSSKELRNYFTLGKISQISGFAIAFLVLMNKLLTKELLNE